ncbi:hypothetical protein [Acinetobacter baumannii]|uniref:hypothetical protein n=2 Tax=Acinetobacter baumannii TaxID=470 RepID=UPI000E695F6B|nr:hypothetical protein [Acinetobacter baumannii]RIX34713.1 hypothetical protein D3X57_19905 [Acinetobacter baumannii]RIX39217.1 hypothetical protein D3X54_17540 [Acinetobacter baumannii]RJO32786.1 hypothetical protein D3X44_16190 [Acinetobacter baumannii]
MKKNSLNRYIFNEGLHTLKVIIFVVLFIELLKVTVKAYLGIELTSEISIVIGLTLVVSLVIYDYLSRLTNKLKIKIHEQIDRNEAIKILEKHNFKVGLVIDNLQTNSEDNNSKECFSAYATLINQNMPVVLVNTDNEIHAKVFYVGEQGKVDHNKYKLILKRDLSDFY